MKAGCLIQTGIIDRARAAENNFVSQCFAPIDVEETAVHPAAEDNLVIESKTVDMKDNIAKFDGNVSVHMEKSSVTAQSAELNRATNQLSVKGDVSFQSPQLSISSEVLDASTTRKDANLRKANYRFNQVPGRGKAEDLYLGSDNSLTLTGASFTSCPEGDESWELNASSIHLSSKEATGEAYHAVLRVEDTPIFYWPYVSFPLNDDRRSGFLYPKISSSESNGVDIEVPYYFNLSPDYDMTLASRLLTRRGNQFRGQFRYLTYSNEGTVGLDYLNDTKKDDQRQLFYYQDRGIYGNNWSTEIDYSDVSDDAYLSDLGSNYHGQNQAVLNQRSRLSYHGDRWGHSIGLESFEVLGNFEDSYRALPQLQLFTTHPHYFYGLDLEWFSEISFFENKKSPLITSARRLHLAPKVSYTLEAPAYKLVTEGSLLHTSYEQIAALDAKDEVKRNVNRTLPKFRVLGQINFERESHWMGLSDHQVLSPKIQYLYVPKRDQKQIHLYDTTSLQENFHGLFRDTRFSSVDRVSSANQFTVGASNSFFDARSNELFYISLGQIFHLETPTTGTEKETNAKNVNSKRSDLAGELKLHLSPNWSFEGEFQYDVSNSNFVESDFTFDYIQGEQRLFQLSHRYVENVANETIEQAGIRASQPISRRWSIVASYYRDLENDRSTESYFGLHYQSCCWAIKMYAQRYIDPILDAIPDHVSQAVQTTTQEPNFETRIAIEFEFVGFGNRSVDPVTKTFKKSIYSYRKPNLLGK